MLRFSVIVPLYNKAPYVRKALDSVMAQTYKDFELIIVDDGSTDNSAVICEEFINSLTPSFVNSLRLLKQSNSGVAAARNNGVKACCGQYVCFLDADDWWEPTFLEEVDKLIRTYPDAGIYCTNYVYYKPGKTHVPLNLPTGYMNYPDAYLRSTAMPIWTGATCMPRTVFNKMGGFPVGIKLGEDFLLWAKTALHYPVAFCEKPLAYYNNNLQASLRATRNLHTPEHHMLFHLSTLEKEITLLSDNALKTDWKRLIDWIRVDTLIHYWKRDEYHNIAAEELAKVDWSQQPKSVIRLYKMPIWVINLKDSFRQTIRGCIAKLAPKYSVLTRNKVVDYET